MITLLNETQAFLSALFQASLRLKSDGSAISLVKFFSVAVLLSAVTFVRTRAL